MNAVRMYIEKFGREVLIDHDHPLAVAQRAAGGRAKPKAPPAGDGDKGEGGADLSRMKRDDLVALAEERGVAVEEDATKKDIIAALEAADEAKKGGE